MKLHLILENLNVDSLSYKQALKYSKNENKTHEIVRIASKSRISLLYKREWWMAIMSCFEIDKTALFKIRHNVREAYSHMYNREAPYAVAGRKDWSYKLGSGLLHAVTGTPLNREHLPEKLRNILYPGEHGNYREYTDENSMEAINKNMAMAFVVACADYIIKNGKSENEPYDEIRESKEYENTTDFPSLGANGSSLDEFLKLKRKHHTELGSEKRIDMAEDAIRQLDRRIAALDSKLLKLGYKIDDGFKAVNKLLNLDNKQENDNESIWS